MATIEIPVWADSKKLDPLMSAQEVSDHLGIKKQTLYAWRVRSCGPRAMRVGKYLRYRLSDVMAWQEANLDPQVP